jgi:hypothetical protein
MKQKIEIKKMTNQDLFDYFKAISSAAEIKPFEHIELKKYDSKNVKNLKGYHSTIATYIKCIQELRKRGYTLWEVMEILK